jgi:hypothetical protein
MGSLQRRTADLRGDARVELLQQRDLLLPEVVHSSDLPILSLQPAGEGSHAATVAARLWTSSGWLQDLALPSLSAKWACQIGNGFVNQAT